MPDLTKIDRNKSTLTHVATAAVAAWLDGIGCKPVETEVPVAEGWIADLATFWSPTMTEAKRSKLLKAMVAGEVNDRAMQTLQHLFRDVGGRLTIAVEVKVSRGDFLADAGRKYGTWGKTERRATQQPPAHFCILACPAGVMLDGENLHRWGRIMLSADCARVTKFDGGWRANPLHPGQIEDLIAAVAIRRDHHTRYESMRRFAKAYRLRHREREAEHRKNFEALVAAESSE